MKEKLSNLLKSYVTIFINEYSNFLNKDQLEILKNINYDRVIKLIDKNVPVGIVAYNQIYLSNNLVQGHNKNISSPMFYNKNYTSYLNYINNYDYDTYKYYADQLMFLTFKLVINSDDGLINGFINYEVNRLRQKYHFTGVNLYNREEVIAKRVINILGYDNCLKIMFLDMPSSFKYLNDYLGYHYADFYYQTMLLVNNVYSKLTDVSYDSPNGLSEYAYNYDHLLYGDVYNYLLDFSINNNHL